MYALREHVHGSCCVLTFSCEARTCKEAKKSSGFNVKLPEQMSLSPDARIGGMEKPRQPYPCGFSGRGRNREEAGTGGEC